MHKTCENPYQLQSQQREGRCGWNDKCLLATRVEVNSRRSQQTPAHHKQHKLAPDAELCKSIQKCTFC
ncbi:hypothetical protein LEMLEM_LOCUS10213 [Lemmus lemmus]